MTNQANTITATEFQDMLESMAELSTGSGVQVLKVPSAVSERVDNGLHQFLESYGVDPGTCFSSYEGKQGRRLSLPGVWVDPNDDLILLFNFPSSERQDNRLILSDIPDWSLVLENGNIYWLVICLGDDSEDITIKVQVHQTLPTPKRVILKGKPGSYSFIKNLNSGGGFTDNWASLPDLLWSGDTFHGVLTDLEVKPMVGKSDGKSYEIYLATIGGSVYRMPPVLGRSIKAQLNWTNSQPPIGFTITRSEVTKEGVTSYRYSGVVDDPGSSVGCAEDF